MACVAAVAGASAAAVSSAAVSRSSVSCSASSSPLLLCKRTVFGAAVRSSNASRRGKGSAHVELLTTSLPVESVLVCVWFVALVSWQWSEVEFLAQFSFGDGSRNFPSRIGWRILLQCVQSLLGSLRLQPLVVRAASSDETSDPSKQLDDVVGDLKAKWDAIENKSAVAVYGGGALVALWLSSTIVGAINSVPLLPKLMELIGLGYTGWFVYRYLLFKSSRKELVEDIEELKGKITGATNSVTGESSATDK
ncbi:hypothetical protein AXG93_1200s1470 [Marchantia polymorpha subsp. ruderalis]|uniref:Cyanobacterial aminoacyl-tRNA synthetase CAAD domain-containing protein n=1 Tax=Marchantia polymorpha subsp. ruderalis TaxID=1480154 RepID=A0A176WLM6_MARPO|nr:hypothetical protein AXG93_1200s1470 [Marchantia polymorpha subsp. ruderalis]